MGNNQRARRPVSVISQAPGRNTQKAHHQYATSDFTRQLQHDISFQFYMILMTVSGHRPFETYDVRGEGMLQKKTSVFYECLLGSISSGWNPMPHFSQGQSILADSHGL